MASVEVTVVLEDTQIWLLRRRFGRRKGDARLVKMAVAEVAKLEAQALLAEEGYSGGVDAETEA